MDYQFKDFTGQIETFGSEEFITVHRDVEANIQGGSKREVISAILMSDSLAKREPKKAQWICNPINLHPGVVRYADGPDKYYRWGNDARLEPLVYQQFFNNLVPTRYQVAEEFILLFNLYEDRSAGQFRSVNIYSDTAAVIKYSDEEISIRKHELRKFLSLKKMTLFLQFEYFFFSQQNLAAHGFTKRDYSKVIKPGYQWTIDYQDGHDVGASLWRSNARLLGKKAVFGYTDYQEPDIFDIAHGKRDYVSFIVDVEENGQSKVRTSNLEDLSEAERKRYAYSPVFFKSEALEKYYKNPELYKVEDGVIIKKGSWTLEIDNDQAGHVSSYLTDLAKLNYEEQCYWRSYNIIPMGGLSDVKFRRDFLVDPTVEPSASDLLFKKYFREFTEKFLKKYTYDLFLPLRPGDEYFLQNIRRPLNDDIHEFDQIIGCLAKTLNDSINDSKLKPQFSVDDKQITLLQKFLTIEFGQDFGMIPVMRAIQDFRSQGVAHRKGSDYQKLFKKLKVENKSRLSIIDGYLAVLALAFRQLSKAL